LINVKLRKRQVIDSLKARENGKHGIVLSPHTGKIQSLFGRTAAIQELAVNNNHLIGYKSPV